MFKALGTFVLGYFEKDRFLLGDTTYCEKISIKSIVVVDVESWPLLIQPDVKIRKIYSDYHREIPEDMHWMMGHHPGALRFRLQTQAHPRLQRDSRFRGRWDMMKKGRGGCVVRTVARTAESPCKHFLTEL